jgi:uncharacterized membrane protein
VKKYLIAYLSTGVVFLALDFLWLGYIARDFMFQRVSQVLAPQPNLTVAALFYLVYIIGILIFAVEPAFKSGAWTTALMFGALFGFFVYATYDLTNLALLKQWPVSVAALDIAWGTFVNAVSATAGFLITRALVSE